MAHGDPAQPRGAAQRRRPRLHERDPRGGRGLRRHPRAHPTVARSARAGCAAQSGREVPDRPPAEQGPRRAGRSVRARDPLLSGARRAGPDPHAAPVLRRLRSEPVRRQGRAGGRLPGALARLAALPRTLAHGDYRLDNMCLRGEGPELQVTTFDWQGPYRGPGVVDLAYFITGNLDVATAAASERALVRAYHDTLVERGVTEYGFDACWHGHQLSKLLIAYRIVLGIDMIDFQSERGVRLIDTWLERLSALLPDDCEALLS
ncbi:MAG: phosphotransferase [Deltaproteobacteria bacterium]|nr:MAG: phosphotransferase [Deltaproteobacteria bacterium]